MAKQLLKHKGPDGKWQTVASYEQGQYGPRIGINAPVLRKLLESEGWVNFSVFQDDRQGSQEGTANRRTNHDDGMQF